jgi:hypothetical protein
MTGLITWTTDVAASSQVDYGTTALLGLSTPYDPARSTAHAVQLPGMVAGATYYFRVRSRNDAGTEYVSGIGSFTNPGGFYSHGLIQWTTDVPATSQVEYGTAITYGTLSPLIDTNTRVLFHSVQLLGLTPGQTYHYRVRSRNAAGTESIGADATFTYAADYSAQIFADNPVGYWRMGESSGTTAVDASGWKNNGTYVGAVTHGTAGASGDGDTATTMATATRVDVLHDQAFSLLGDLTLECWVYPTSRSSSGMLITKDTAGGTANNNYEWRLEVTTGLPTFRQFTTGISIVSGTVAVPLNQWSLIAVTKSGATVTHYINGVANGSGTLAGTPTINSLPLRFGTRDDLAGYFIGRLDEVALYPSALTSTRLQAHYTSSASASLIVALDTTLVIGAETITRLVTNALTDTDAVLAVETALESAVMSASDTDAVLGIEALTPTASMSASDTDAVLGVESGTAGTNYTATDATTLLSSAVISVPFVLFNLGEATPLVSSEAYTPIGAFLLNASDAALILSSDSSIFKVMPSNGDSTQINVLSELLTIFSPRTLTDTTPLVVTTENADAFRLLLVPASDTTSLIHSADAGSVAVVAPPVISAVVASRISDTSILITWTTDKPSTSQVEYGTTIVYGLLSPLDSRLVGAHSVTLDNLLPSTLYYFRVRSDG